jgi:hypothetical protein
MPIKAETILSGKDLKEFQSLSPEEQASFQSEFNDTVLEMLKPVTVAIGAAERVLAIVLESDLLATAAKLQRRYYLELLSEGFSSDQALALSSSFASMLQAVKKQ